MKLHQPDIPARVFAATELHYSMGNVPRRALFCVLAGATFPDLAPIQAEGWDVVVADDLPAARVLLGEHAFPVSVVFLGGAAEEREMRQLEGLLACDDRTHWVGVFPAAQLENEKLLELIAQHFYDYHTLPTNTERLQITLGHAYGMAHLCKRLLDRFPCTVEHQLLLGVSEAMKRVLRGLRKMAACDAPVLLCGESGTGKELAANVLHLLSTRSERPFVAVNCGALPAALIQSELFGHEKGAFTGALHRHIGRFEMAQRGTLFLDEIGDLPLDLQVNLLRFLQEGTIERVGSTEPMRLDVRVVAATHVDLEEQVKMGRFREDLHYRLNVLQLTLPPLRERSEDIELLARHYFAKFTYEQKYKVKGFNRAALRMMNRYSWPGNVRELMNRVQRAVIMSEGGLISPRDLGLERRTAEPRMVPLRAAREAAEKSAVRSALNYARNNHSLAADDLGVSRTTLYRLMKKYEIND